MHALTNNWTKRLIGLTSALLLSAAAQATAVLSSTTSLGGGDWQFRYQIVNAPASPSFDELTIYFESDKYSNLVLSAAPGGWDSLLIQPDPGIPADGYLDVLRLGGPMPDDEIAAGFSVSFRYLGVATPGSQRFELIDSSAFVVKHEGSTTSAGGAVDSIPEPASISLTLLALAAGAHFSKKAGRRKIPRCNGFILARSHRNSTV